jgi:glycogen(starch) synthase
MPPENGRQPLPVIVVASWYPGVDDPARGRFVADQADALAATRRISPLVITFDTALIDGDQLNRVSELGAVQRHVTRGIAERHDAINPSGWGLEPGVAVARVSLLEGVGRATPSGSDGDLRREALLSLGDDVARAMPGRGVVHAHTGYPDGYAGAALASHLGWPLVITEHASFVARQLRQPAQRQRYLAAVEAAARFLAVSQMLADELEKAIPQLAGKLEVMPNAIPLHQYAVNLDSRRPEELLFVGYRKPTKGMATLLRAFADVHAARPSATLRLIGRSPTEDVEHQWHQLSRDLGIRDAVQFEGTMDRAGVAAAMARASVLVHPSPRETFGMTTLEALASGTPVVATRSGGISGILEDGRLGELVPPQDSRALARAVIRTLERRESFEPTTLRAAVEPYSSIEVGGRLASLYASLAAEAPPAVRRLSGDLIWQGAATAEPGRVLVFANDTARAAALLRSMPVELLGRMLLVTAGADDDELPDGIRTILRTHEDTARELRRIRIEGPRGTTFDRARRLLANPLAAIRRRLSIGGVGTLRWQAAVVGSQAALARSAEVRAFLADGPVEAVCVDAIDHVIADPMIADGRATPVPGGLLWLADRWASRRLEPAPPPSQFAEVSLSPTNPSV